MTEKELRDYIQRIIKNDEVCMIYRKMDNPFNIKKSENVEDAR